VGDKRKVLLRYYAYVLASSVCSGARARIKRQECIQKDDLRDRRHPRYLVQVGNVLQPRTEKVEMFQN